MINRAACGILFLDLFLLSLYFLELNKIGLLLLRSKSSNGVDLAASDLRPAAKWRRLLDVPGSKRVPQQRLRQRVSAVRPDGHLPAVQGAAGAGTVGAHYGGEDRG